MSRPRVPLLSVERITGEAITMLDEGKPLGINQLAKRLSVNPSSLYNHISGRDELIELIRGKLAEDFHIAVPPGQNWDDVVRYVVRSQRAMFAAHPHVLPLLVSQTATDTRVISYYEELAAALTRAGFAGEDALEIIAALDAFALGAGLDLSAPPEAWHPSSPDSALGRLLATSSSPDNRSERAFELGLTLIVEALAARLAGSQRISDSLP